MTKIDATTWATKCRPSGDDRGRELIPEVLRDGDVMHTGQIIKFRKGWPTFESKGSVVILRSQFPAAAYYGWRLTGVDGTTLRGPVVEVMRS